MFYPLAAIMSSLLPVRTNVPGVRWSRYLYMAVTGMTGLNECGGLCLMAGNITCHYYLFLTGTCFLGNILTSKSVINLRTDTQNIYVAIGKEMLKFVMVRKSLFFA
jgi:hypothetical protein